MNELERKVADLERRVKELEGQPREQHFHYHPPVYVQPAQPIPTQEPYRIYIGDPPGWGTIVTSPWIPNSNGTVTWSGGNQ
jgi:hypothetical protein